MRIIAKRTIRTFWNEHSGTENPLKNWYRAVSTTDWKNFREVKETFGATDYVGNDRYVFNIKGNNIRIVAKIDFSFRLVFIRFIGTHQEYDSMNKKFGAKEI